MAKQDDIQKLIEVFKEYSTFDFSNYSTKSFGRRIDKLLIDETSTIDNIISKISKNPKYLNEIKNKITVNTTELFRDSEMWISLYKPIIENIKNKSTLNVWHAGVSSGEELYSMKIYLEAIGYSNELNITGSDLNERILASAKEGVYKNNIIADYIENYNLIKNELTNNTNFKDITEYFKYDKKKNLLQVKKHIKSSIDFRIVDLVAQDYNFETKFDIIMCRNVLIYFNLNLQNEIIERFYNLLNPDGILVLGAHENIMPPLSDNFEEINTIYMKK